MEKQEHNGKDAVLRTPPNVVCGVAAALGSNVAETTALFTQHSVLGWIVALSFSKHCEFCQKTFSGLHPIPALSLYLLGDQTEGLWTLLHQSKRTYQPLELFWSAGAHLHHAAGPAHAARSSLM